MGVKLYNHTKISDSILLPVLTDAKRLVGVKGNIIVLVTRGQNWCRGNAQSAIGVYKYTLQARSRRDRNGKYTARKLIKTDGGYIRISIPFDVTPFTYAADLFFKIMLHEFGHVKDFQRPDYHTLPWSERGIGKRRAKHDARPEEIRAENYKDEAWEKYLKGKNKWKVDIHLLAFASAIAKQVTGSPNLS